MPILSPQPSVCSEPLLFSFNDLGPRQVMADFSAGYLSSDGGMLLLRQIDEGLGISRSLARCFYDARNPFFIEHSVRELVAQRLLGLAAGYEDLNDHNLLRLDPLFAVAVGKEDPLGSGRAAQDQGKALASASTLNRLELGNNKNTRCHKISADHEAIEDNLLEMGVRCLPKHSLEVVIDLDATDDPLHGHQEGRFFHGFYGCYCYLPLFAFVGSVPLWAQLRTSEGDAARGAVDALQKIVAAVRKRCRKARIIVRADSGFCREELMAWCESQQPVVYYCLGLARNSRLRELIDEKFARVRESAILCGGVARSFTEFHYQTLKSWTRSRRVIAKPRSYRTKTIRVLLSPTCLPRALRTSRSPLSASAPKSVMKTFTVHAVTWKTRLSNSIWTWKPIAPAATGWLAISYGCGSALSLCCSSRDCARWPCRALNWPTPRPVPSGNGS